MRALDRLRSPRAPVDGVVLVLEEVRAGLARQAVRHVEFRLPGHRAGTRDAQAEQVATVTCPPPRRSPRSRASRARLTIVVASGVTSGVNPTHSDPSLHR